LRTAVGATEILPIEGPEDHRDEIVDVDPGKELPAVSEPAAEPQ
jgi:hypothetical protein